MPHDYQSNSQKSKDGGPGKASPIDAPEVQKVVTGEVITRKKPTGKKLKELFINADVKSVILYVCTDVLVPAAKNMIVDAGTKGLERMFNADPNQYRRHLGNVGQSRITYNAPVNRDSMTNRMLSPVSQTLPRQARQQPDEIILSDRAQCEAVLEQMDAILETYRAVSVLDMKSLLGLATTPVENKWGWTNLSGARVIQIREGYLLDLPPYQPL